METSTRVRAFTHRYAPVENVGAQKRAGSKRSTATPSPKTLKTVKVGGGAKKGRPPKGKASSATKKTPSKKVAGKVKTAKKTSPKAKAAKGGPKAAKGKAPSPVRKHHIPDLDDLVYTEAALEDATASMLETGTFLSKSACMSRFCLPPHICETLAFSQHGEGSRLTVPVMDVQAACSKHLGEEDTEKYLAHALSRRKEYKEEEE